MPLGIRKKPSSTCERAPARKLCASSAASPRARRPTKFQRLKQTSVGVFRSMSHPLFDLSGRVAFVSGAASGMGRQMSIGFAESGADVVLADINLNGAHETAHEIEKLGRRAIPVACDVSKVDQIRAAYALIDKEFGHIDIVGNVAGEGKLSIPLEVKEEAIVQTLQNLVVGRFFSCQEAGRRMLKQG